MGVGHTGHILGSGYALYLDRVFGYTGICICQNSVKAHLRIVCFIGGKILYQKKKLQTNVELQLMICMPKCLEGTQVICNLLCKTLKISVINRSIKR